MDLGGYDDNFDALAAIAYRVAYRMVGSREDARDIAQETMARAFVHWRRASKYPEAWVSRVASNIGIDQLRRRGRLRHDESPIATNPDSLALERMELVRVLAALPRRQREVVVMRYLADRPESDVARELGCSPGTVKQHASRGLAALRISLTQTALVPIPTEEP
jgi:RNA polymerase sigma factor (sigma-70 family)